MGGNDINKIDTLHSSYNEEAIHAMEDVKNNKNVSKTFDTVKEMFDFS